MHRQMLAQFFQFFHVARRFQSNQSSDLAQAFRYRAVDITDDNTVFNAQLSGTAQMHVLTDLGNQIRQSALNIFARRNMLRNLQSFQIRIALQRYVGNRSHKRLEQFVTRNKVRFGIDFDNGAFLAVDLQSNQTLRCNASRFLGRSGQTFFAQPVNCFFYITGGFRQRFLAIHHACARLFAQFFYDSGRNFCHCFFLSE